MWEPTAAATWYAHAAAVSASHHPRTGSRGVTAPGSNRTVTCCPGSRDGGQSRALVSSAAGSARGQTALAPRPDPCAPRSASSLAPYRSTPALGTNCGAIACVGANVRESVRATAAAVDSVERALLARMRGAPGAQRTRGRRVDQPCIAWEGALATYAATAGAASRRRQVRPHTHIVRLIGAARGGVGGVWVALALSHPCPHPGYRRGRSAWSSRPRCSRGSSCKGRCCSRRGRGRSTRRCWRSRWWWWRQRR